MRIFDLPSALAMLALCVEAAFGLVNLGPLLLRPDYLAGPQPPGWQLRPEAPLPPPLPASIVQAAGASPSRTRVVEMAVAAPPKIKSRAGSTSVTNRGGGQLISWYFRSISSTRLLTAQQEQQLARMIIAGDDYEAVQEELAERLGRRPRIEEWASEVGLDKSELRKRMRRANCARDLMVAANMRLVVSIVRPYLAPNAVAGGALSMEDLVQEGSLGLLKAVGRFRPERGLRFSTYATWWIRTTVQRAVADQARTIRLPFGKSRMLSKAKRVHDQLVQQHGRKPSGARRCAVADTCPALRPPPAQQPRPCSGSVPTSVSAAVPCARRTPWPSHGPAIAHHSPALRPRPRLCRGGACPGA